MILLCLASPNLSLVEVIYFQELLFLPPSHRKTLSLCSRAFLSSACLSAQPPSPAGALTERTHPALAGLFSSWSSEQSRAAPKHRAPGDPWGIQHRNMCEWCPCTSVIIISSPLHSKLVIITIPWVRKLRSKAFSDLPESSQLASVGAKRLNQVSLSETLSPRRPCVSSTQHGT